MSFRCTLHLPRRQRLNGTLTAIRHLVPQQQRRNRDFVPSSADVRVQTLNCAAAKRNRDDTFSPERRRFERVYLLTANRRATEEYTVVSVDLIESFDGMKFQTSRVIRASPLRSSKIIESSESTDSTRLTKTPSTSKLHPFPESDNNGSKRWPDCDRRRQHNAIARRSARQSSTSFGFRVLK